MDHYDAQVAAVIDQLPLQVGATVDVVHALLGQRCGVAQLVLQIDAVDDHHHLEVLQVGASAQLAHEEDHGEALPASLGMPDSARTCVGIRSRPQPLHDLAHGAVLLVTRHHLHQPLAGAHEDVEVAHQIKEHLLVQHALHQHLLAALLAQWRGVARVLLRVDALPLIEVLWTTCDRAEAGLLPRGRDEQLIDMEQALLAFS